MKSHLTARDSSCSLGLVPSCVDIFAKMEVNSRSLALVFDAPSAKNQLDLRRETSQTSQTSETHKIECSRSFAHRPHLRMSSSSIGRLRSLRVVSLMAPSGVPLEQKLESPALVSEVRIRMREGTECRLSFGWHEE